MIQFTKDIDAEKLRMAYNNDVLRFYSDSTTQPLYADVSLSQSGLFLNGQNPVLFSARLYPNPKGHFYINLQPYVAATINTRNFEDTLQTAITAGNVSSFTYSFGNGTVLSGTLNIKVTYSLSANPDTATRSLIWLAGAQQPESYVRLAKNDMLVLSPFKKDTLQEYYLKYWQGYPFDVSVYYQTGVLARLRYLDVANTSNGLSQQFNLGSNITRLVFSDGRTDETLETMLPMAEGTNRLKVTVETKHKWVVIEKAAYRSGVYLKWLNAMGGYSYWLFEDTYAIDRSSKYTGEIESETANPEDSFGRTLQLGKESQDTIKIVAELLTDEERRIVEGLLDSPKIYLFTGKPFSQNSNRNWVEVTLKTGSARLRNPKQPLTNFAFDIELPARYVQGL